MLTKIKSWSKGAKGANNGSKHNIAIFQQILIDQ